jgi:hypothetical protein
MPSGFADISELLLPELRRRDALAPHYPGRTLRENLALGHSPVAQARAHATGGGDAP